MTYRVGELYDALVAAGASPDQASKAAEAVAGQNQAVTKSDLAVALAELKAELLKWQFAQSAAIVAIIIAAAFLK